MSVAALIREAAEAGIWLSINGDKLSLKAQVKPPDVLIARLKASKPEIIELLRQKAPLPPPAARRECPLAMSYALSQAIEHAAHFHIQFWLEDGLLITRPPQDYRREVQAAERALMARTGEIKTLCAWQQRPKGYSDANWLRAVAESCKLGYNKWEVE